MIAASWDRAYSRLRSVSNVEALGRSSSELLTEILLLVVLGVLSYGLLIPSLGYYWDDWRILWIGSGHSPTNLLENYAYRPGTAWLFSALNRYVGTNYPLAHCMALSLRITSSLVFWRIVRLAWPSCPTLAFASSALFLVYPGFSQQSISLTYQNYHLCILLCLLSLLLMLKGLFNERFHIKCLLIFASLILQMTYLLIIDNMISWEAMRWALILTLALRYSGSVWAALALSISRAFPFVLTAIGFYLWRSFFVRSSRVDVDFTAVLSSWRSLSFREIATRIPGGVLSNILDCSIFAWTVQAWKGANYSDRVLLAGLCVAVFGAALSYSRLRRWSAGEGPKSWSREFILVGGFSLLIMSIFQCVLRRNVHLDDESDRFAYSASAAAVFLVVGLSSFSLGRRATVHFITLLIGLSILSDFSHACIYKKFWEMERSLNWQLAWRAPDIEPGTLVVIARPRVGFWLDDFEICHDINAPLNLHYTNSETPLIGLPLTEEAIEFTKSVSNGRRDEILDHVRYNIKRNLDYLPPMQVQEPPGVLLMFLSHPGATLRTVDLDRLEELPQMPPSINSLTKSTRVGVIRGSGPLGVPTNQLMGKEPPHTWAWHFQRAELARQFGDYEELGRLLAEVYGKHLTPGDPSELLIFLEAAMRTKHEDGAAWIIREFRSRHKSFIPRLKTWLNKFLTRAEGSERAFAASLSEKLDKVD